MKETKLVKHLLLLVLSYNLSELQRTCHWQLLLHTLAYKGNGHLAIPFFGTFLFMNLFKKFLYHFPVKDY